MNVSFMTTTLKEKIKQQNNIITSQEKDVQTKRANYQGIKQSISEFRAKPGWTDTQMVEKEREYFRIEKEYVQSSAVLEKEKITLEKEKLALEKEKFAQMKAKSKSST